jgi:hypothetical protein
MTRFIDHLQVVTTNIYNTIANFHTLQIRSTPACSVFTRRFLVTASNDGYSSASRAQVHSSQTPVQNLSLAYNISARATYKHPVSNSTSIVARRFVAVGTCLPSRCPVTALVYPPILRSLSSNYSSRYNTLLSSYRIIFGPVDKGLSPKLSSHS